MMNWVVVFVFALFGLLPPICRAADSREPGANRPAPTSEATKPLWEVGLVGAAARFPQYRGSDEYQIYALPLPFLVYRGELLQANREGVRGIFYKGERVETDLSMSGNPPVGRNNDARRGMPELNPLVEAGPALKLYLHRTQPSSSLYVEAAVRGVFSVNTADLHPGYEGYRGELSLNMIDYQPGPGSPWYFGSVASADWADRRYNRYFYDVTAEQALPDRPEFRSAGGFGGFSWSGYVSYEFSKRFSWGAYARWDSLDGAVYEDSPLVRTRNNYVVGTAVIWTLSESKRRVPADR